MRTDMLRELERIVRLAGDMVREAHDIEQVTTEKTGAADLVTKYDVAVQGFLKRELLTLLPEADFFGEEGEHAALTRRLSWTPSTVPPTLSAACTTATSPWRWPTTGR